MPLFGIGKKINHSLMSITEIDRTQRCGFPLCLRAFSSVSDLLFAIFYAVAILLWCTNQI